MPKRVLPANVVQKILHFQSNLTEMVQNFGRVVSVKILRDEEGQGTGTGFTR